MGEIKKLRRHFRAGLLGGGLLAVLGWMVVDLNMGEALARFSYDFPFWFHRFPPVTNVVLVDVNESAMDKYRDPQTGAMDRRVHARLLEKLTEGHSKLVFYDFIFDSSNHIAGADDKFAQAMRSQRTVVLGGSEAYPPTIQFRDAAQGRWGLLNVEVDPPDYAVRRIFVGTTNPSAVWVAAMMLGAEVTQQPERRLVERWLNYYGPSGTGIITNCDFEQVLDGKISVDYFANKIVVVCPRFTIPAFGNAEDQWPNPYSRFGPYPKSTGGEIQASALLNLLRNEWLTRMGRGYQILLVTALGIVLGLGLTLLRPWHAAWVAILFAVVIFGVACILQWNYFIWWSWAIPAVVQAPLAVGWSIGVQYALETRKRLRLRRAFAAYLSPQMADQIAESDFDLALGGKMVEATIMFTDLKGFTAISESLEPEQVSRLLTTYFNETSRTILERKGTIIKYIGDAIMAVWGAPLSDPRQAENAVLAAWDMVQAGRKQIAGQNLQTRVGINSGRVLAGNLGSDLRFDYTVIGDTTNFASRLEGFNKHFGTEILISDITRQQLSGDVMTRKLGRFQIPGKFEPVVIHEVLGLAGAFADGGAWVQEFEKGLTSFSQRDFDQAENRFRRVIHMRGGIDGPSAFYLERISTFRKSPPEDPWGGVVTIASK